ncbi:hypothetical protein Vasula_00027 [Pseudomonas phage vB_PpuP-Vasula]
MCFSKKMKIPKPNTDQKAPEPVLLEAPKGVEYGDGADDDSSSDSSTSSKGLSSLKVTKDKDKGDGSQSTAIKDTGLSPTKKTSAPAIKRALKR